MSKKFIQNVKTVAMDAKICMKKYNHYASEYSMPIQNDIKEK